MTSEQLICDRCGKVISKNLKNHSKIHCKRMFSKSYQVFLEKYFPLYISNREYDRKDLCEECTKEFYKWFDEAKENK